VKKFLFFFCLVVFFDQVLAAEYVIKKGDCLATIAIKVNTTAINLANLNEIQNMDLVFPGQKIVYLDDQDLADAKAWAKKRMSELSSSDGNYQVFSYVAKDIDSLYIRYSVNEPNGAHAELILDFAQAWRKQL
jgi:hypothetical protein